MNCIEFLKENDLGNTNITRVYPSSWTEHEEELYSIQIKGDYVKDDFRHYDLFFSRIHINEPELKEKIELLGAMEHPVLKSVSAVERKIKGYDAELVIEDGGRTISINCMCDYLEAYGSHYRGFDYTNVFGTPEYLKMTVNQSYVFDGKYFKEEEITQLPDGISFCERKYIHESDQSVHARGTKCELSKDDKCVYSFTTCDDHHRAYREFIMHSNGHRYYPFHIDLYGISYIDVDTLEVFNYVPRGYDNSFGMPNGESFIVTDVHYDPVSDLIAYGGCYWAGTSDVMVGKFEDPLDFDPHLISTDTIIDPEDEAYNEVDFVSWDEDGITVKFDGDNGKGTEKIPFEKLKKEFGIQSKARK